MLRRQLYRIFVSILLIPALLIGLYLLIYNYRIIYDHHSDMLKSDNLRVRSIIYDVTTALTNVCEIISTNEGLHTVLSTEYESTHQAYNALMDFSLLKELNNRYPEISSLKVYTDNTTLSTYGHVVRIDETQTAWFEKALLHPGYKWGTNTYTDKYNNQYKELQVVYPIIIPNSDIDALLVISVSGNYLKNRINNNTLNVNLAVNDDTIFFSTMQNEDQHIAFHDYQTTPYFSYTGMDTYDEDKALVEVSALKPVKTSDFIYIFSVDKQAINRLDRLLNTEILIIAFTILIPTIVIGLYTRQLTFRITTLRTEMHRVTAGDYNIIDTFKGNDELADLFYDLKVMIHAIKSRDQKIYEISLEEQRLLTHQGAMEFQLLSSKINPHFLYNTLETIRMKAFNSGNREVSNAVKLLGKYMRYNLESSSETKSLAEELEYIQLYLDIQKLRFRERIHYEIYMDTEIDPKELYILPLLIQPLVENALLHGHEDTLEKGMIWIRCITRDGQLRIEIEDNGKGMRPETLVQVKQKIEISEMTDKHSFGLHNIQQRLRILYGESSGLTFDTAPNVGTCIGFSIPLSQLERKL